MTSFYYLGDPLSNLKICCKILRSLSDRFSAKVVALEERHEVDEISFGELVGKLQTFELNHMSKKTSSKPTKGIAFKSSQVDPHDSDDEDDDLSPEEMAFFAKRYKQLMKSRQVRSFSKSNTQESKESRGLQCHECSGYGHFASECANTLKKKGNKG